MSSFSRHVSKRNGLTAAGRCCIQVLQFRWGQPLLPVRSNSSACLFGRITVFFPQRAQTPSACLKMRQKTIRIRSYPALFPETLGDNGNKLRALGSTCRCSTTFRRPWKTNRSSTNSPLHARAEPDFSPENPAPRDSTGPMPDRPDGRRPASHKN